MKKLFILLFTVFTAAALSGCDDFRATNEPRKTATNKAAVLTTLTSASTSRPETYSEYISSLHEMESSIREEARKTIGGMERDTAVRRETGETPDTLERVTGITRPTDEALGSSSDSKASESSQSSGSSRISADTAVTTVPADETEASETVTCTVQTTLPPDDLSDIPPVPSGLVKED